MSKTKFESDLNTREPIFTIPDLQPRSGEERIPAAHIWSGLSRGGRDKYLPILFDHTDSEITPEFISRFGKFTDEEKGESVKPIVYQDSASSVDPILMEIRYRVKPVLESEVDTELDGQGAVFDAAKHWKFNYSESTLEYKQSIREYGFLYRLDFMVYGTPFTAKLPIFAGKPTESELREGLKQALIPCVAIVPSKESAFSDIELLETRIEPTVFRPR
ncbi:hypothetical protein BDK88_0096 [Natrinema hispanicum]|uniref:Uncharacterized protein n=1 Tax=Natrinema hispanicum TaxID=392421 RepID=A0A482YE91_9EURY|nr:hypothetical protein [Natrinema hispanicum]RZV12557.1 hypothetical protein BDK88_0096 [Natrinema hispanicum]